MNRRGFLRSLGAIAAGFSILPAATTYARNWKPVESGLLMPEDFLPVNMILKENLKCLKKARKIAMIRIQIIYGEPKDQKSYFAMCQNSDTYHK